MDIRYWYGRFAIAQGKAKLYKVAGDTQQPADIGTKAINAGESQYYRYLFEANHYSLN